jgi:hypothetical protein
VTAVDAVAVTECPGDHERGQHQRGERRLEKGCVLDIDRREEHRVQHRRDDGRCLAERSQSDAAQNGVHTSEDHPRDSSDGHRVRLTEDVRERGGVFALTRLFGP